MKCLCIITKRRFPKKIEVMHDLWEDVGGWFATTWQTHMSPYLENIKANDRDIRSLLKSINKAAADYGQRKDVLSKIDSMIEKTYDMTEDFMTDELKSRRKERKKQIEKASKKVSVPAMKKSARIWITDTKGNPYMTDDRMSQVVMERVTRMRGQNKTDKQIVANIRRFLQAKIGLNKDFGRSQSYWQGVADYVGGMANVRATLDIASSEGYKYIQVVNPMDERTTPFCAMMNGKKVRVSDMSTFYDRLDKADTVDKIKKAKPFVSGTGEDELKRVLGKEVRSGRRTFSNKDSKALSDAGIIAPPYHFRCRSYLNVID